jgi:enoyl-CoA hydratase/carnithine racemase
MAGSEDVLCSIDDPVAVVTLNRPERLNAFTFETLGRLRAAVDAAAADAGVVGIVITGAGRGFCSGLDVDTLAEAAELGSASRPEATDELPGLFSWLLSIEKPVIAAVNGVAAGGGLVLAALCDVRIAGPDASFTTIFGRRGLISEHGTSWVLPRLVGMGHALDLLWTSRRIDADEAYRIGLVEHRTDSDPVVAAQAYVQQLADEVSPSSLRDMKRLVHRHAGMPYDASFREADELQWVSLGRADATEGARAFAERRAPAFARLPLAAS